MRGVLLRFVPCLLVAMGVVLGLLGLLAPPASGLTSPARPAVLVLVPELTWANAPRVLDGYAKASLSMRSARARTTAADGYLSVGKVAPSAAPGDMGVGRVAPAPEGGLVLLDWERLRRHDQGLHQPGHLGRLGAAIEHSGRPWALVAIDPAAAAAAADEEGVVARALPPAAAEVGHALSGGAEAVVVGVPRTDVPSVVVAAGSACVVVASVSTPQESRHLGVLAASPACGLGTAGLASPSTHHDHLATLIDVGPTYLSRLGLDRPPAVAGSAVTAAPETTRAALEERDRRTFSADGARSSLVWLFVGLSALGAVVGVLRPRARVPIAYALLTIPPASFLVMLLPWWRWGIGGAVLAGAPLGAALGLGAAVLGRRDVRLGVGALAAAAAVVVGVDALFGGRLEIDAPFGNSPVVGARFFGVGNIGSGFLAAGLLVAGGIGLDRWGRRAWPAVAVALAAGVVVGGAPWFGADVGGVLAFVPAYALLLLCWREGRPPLRRVVLAVGAAAVVLALVVLVDVVRPDADQSHLGRAVAGDGSAEQLRRKADRALGTIRSPMALLLPIGALALARARPGLSGRPALQAAAWALLTAGVAGTVLNDSGLVVGASVIAVAWPAFLALGAPPPPPEPEGDRHRTPAAVTS